MFGRECPVGAESKRDEPEHRQNADDVEHEGRTHMAMFDHLIEAPPCGPEIPAGLRKFWPGRLGLVVHERRHPFGGGIEVKVWQSALRPSGMPVELSIDTICLWRATIFGCGA